MKGALTLPPENRAAVVNRMEARTGNPVQAWKCPCGGATCDNVVFYSPENNPQTGESGVYFVATLSFDPRGGIGIHIDNVEDLNQLLDDDRVNDRDRMLYAMWFHMGLREVLLGAIL